MKNLCSCCCCSYYYFFCCVFFLLHHHHHHLAFFFLLLLAFFIHWFSVFLCTWFFFYFFSFRFVFNVYLFSIAWLLCVALSLSLHLSHFKCTLLLFSHHPYFRVLRITERASACSAVWRRNRRRKTSLCVQILDVVLCAHINFVADGPRSLFSTTNSVEFEALYGAEGFLASFPFKIKFYL